MEEPGRLPCKATRKLTWWLTWVLLSVSLTIHEPSDDWLLWEQAAKAVRHLWLLVGPKLRERPEAWPRVTPEVEPDIPLGLP
eukprot:5286219-Amphidinium_carterae.1